MTDVHTDSPEMRKNLLDYLKELSRSSADRDVEVKNAARTGFLCVRQGRVLTAECGNLQGNGALLTLAAAGVGAMREREAGVTVASNVSLTLAQLERVLAQLPGSLAAPKSGGEERLLQQAVRLFFEFRRKEAGARLVELLRANRFYYPAWLWHSRLMTREDHIRRALAEAKRWGNVDLSVQREVAKIEPQLTGSAEPVRRCIFCWSLLRVSDERCAHCRGLQRIVRDSGSGVQPTGDLEQSLAIYEGAWQNDSANARIAYCLCLGYTSLGRRDRALEFLDKALELSPSEPLFLQAARLLNPGDSLSQLAQVEKPAAELPAVPGVAPTEPASAVAAKGTAKTILVVEDSRTARKVVSMVVGREGYRIIEAASGSEALLAIAGLPPDLVLLDVMLPDMSGYEVLAEIRKKASLATVPVVMLTGKRGLADRQKGLAGGSNEYLTKPFDPAKLLAVLNRYLQPAARQADTASVRPVKPIASPPPPVVRAKPVVPEPAIARPAAPAAEAKAAIKAPEAAVAPAAASGRSVLVVEDSPTSRKVITMVLSREGYQVNEAATGGDAYRKAESLLPQLILLDAMLPDMTGYDILAMLKQHPRLRAIPVVMLTARVSPLDREKGLRAGAAAYLTKPFNPEKLLSVIGGYF